MGDVADVEVDHGGDAGFGQYGAVEQGVVVPAVGSEAEGEGINLDGGRGGGHKTGEDDEFGEHDRSNLSLQLPFWVNENYLIDYVIAQPIL